MHNIYQMNSQSPNNRPRSSVNIQQNNYEIMVQQFKNSYQSTGAGNRMNHILTYFNQQIFVFGGTSASNIKQDEHYRVVYWYSLENRQWNKKQFHNLIKNEQKQKQKDKEKEKERQMRERSRDNRQKQKEKQRQKDKQQQALNTSQNFNLFSNTTTRSFMASCLKQHKLYLFGGTNDRNESNNDLLVFDLKKYEWESPKNQNPPQPRQSAFLSVFMDSYLILYGGINVQLCQIYEHFYCYNIEHGFWKIIQDGNYLTILRPRYLFSACTCNSIGDKIYLFGGEYRNADGYHRYLSDFYQITITVSKKSQATPSITYINVSQSNLRNKNVFEDINTFRVDCLLIREPIYEDLNNNLNNSNSNGNKKQSRKNSYQMIDAIQNQNKIQIQNKRQEKTYPQSKSGHKLLPINNDYLILIGGANSQHYNLQDVWVYSINNNIWKKIQLNNSIPKQGGIDCCAVLREVREKQKDREKEKQRQRQRQRERQKQKQQKLIKQNRQYAALMRVDARQTRSQKQKKQQKKQNHKNKEKEKEKQKDKDKQRQNRAKQRQQIRQKQQRKQQNKNEKNPLGNSNLVGNYNTIFIYGGLNCYDSVRCDLYSLNFQQKSDSQSDSQQNQNKMDEQISQQMNKRVHNNRQRTKSSSKTLQQLFYVQPIKKCTYCQYPKQKVYLNKSIIDNFTNMINFPFNAIGLFLQNAYHNNATEFCVGYRNQVLQSNRPVNFNSEQFHYSYSSRKLEVFQQNIIVKVQPFLHIIQNNHIDYLTYQQLKSSIGNFQSILHFTYHNIEKKVKLALQKQHQLHQFGVYLKIGALRLGTQFLYITRGSKGQHRVFAFFPVRDQSNEQQYYQFCTYMWNPLKKQLITQHQPRNSNLNFHSYSYSSSPHHKPEPSTSYLSTKPYYQYSYQKIQEKYSKYIDDLIITKKFQEHANVNINLNSNINVNVNLNHLFIFNLRQTMTKGSQFIGELLPNLNLVDICYSPYRKMLETHQPGIYQSIDLSLRAYMSSYFLKNQLPKMSIKVNNSTKQITQQICLESFDLMAKNKCVYQIDNGLMNIQIKLMELYFNPNLKNSTISFHNGILFYHKGRLVARHGCPIGDLYRKFNKKDYNYFSLFGLLQVPQAILPNIFRTEFIFNVMMEKLRSRLKFIEKKLISQFENQNHSSINNLIISQQQSSQQKCLKATKKVSTKQKQKEKQKQKQKQKQKEKDKDNKKQKEKQERQKEKQKKDDTQFNPGKRY